MLQHKIYTSTYMDEWDLASEQVMVSPNDSHLHLTQA